jgi:hypothetical protein
MFHGSTYDRRSRRAPAIPKAGLVLLAFAGCQCGSEGEGEGLYGTGWQETGGSDTGAAGGTKPSAATAGGMGGATGGAPVQCSDLPDCGNVGSGCVGCAVDAACANLYTACFESADCVAYDTCFVHCAGEPSCIDDCAKSKVEEPEMAKVLFERLFDCAICTECRDLCPEASLCAS